MVERSLQASPAGIQAAKTALISLGLNQQKLATRLGVTRQPISKFFNEKPVDRNIFVQICETLKLDWQELTEQPQPKTESDIDALVQAVREHIKPLIKERCGTMRVLDMTQPVALTGEQGIYTNVNILEKITGRRRLGINELSQGCNPDEFDRFGSSGVTEKRVPGLEAVEHYSKLMVLGKPGAGKTTFLKFLAMRCIEGNFQADRIPIFIRLKDFALEKQPSLSTYTNRFISRFLDSDQTNILLNTGKVLFLLDGLDEIKEENTNQVIQEIEGFSEFFHRNKIIITCRTGMQDDSLEQFIKVEILDLSNQEITFFANNFFHSKNGSILAENFLRELSENDSIKELAKNKLSLMLLCSIFKKFEHLPSRQIQLYELIIEHLFRKWNPQDRKVDFIYKKLSPDYREELIYHIAFQTFKDDCYSFRYKNIKNLVRDFIQSLPGIAPEDLLRLDCKALLDSIVVQNGLLTEESSGIYSFPHFTFHEYFTARKIVEGFNYDRDNNLILEFLISKATNKRWQEVILFTTQMLSDDDADNFLVIMKDYIDSLLAGNKAIQILLKQINNKVPVNTTYQKAAVRVFQLSCVCEFFTKVSLEDSIDLAIKSSNDSSVFNFLYKDYYGICNYKYNSAFTCSLSDTFAIISHSIYDPQREYKVSCMLDPDRARFFLKSMEFLWDECEIKSFGEQPYSQTYFEEWWRVNSQSWTDGLNQIMASYYSFGHDCHFSEEQKHLLEQYYNANRLLVNCLDSCHINREVRQEIEDTLLLPIAEIEKYKAAKATQQSD